LLELTSEQYNDLVRRAESRLKDKLNLDGTSHAEIEIEFEKKLVEMAIKATITTMQEYERMKTNT